MTEQGKYRLRLLLVAMALITSGSGYVYSAEKNILPFTLIFLITMLLIVFMLVIEVGQFGQPKPKDNGQKQTIVYRFNPSESSRTHFNSVSTKEIVDGIMIDVLSKYVKPLGNGSAAVRTAPPNAEIPIPASTETKSKPVVLSKELRRLGLHGRTVALLQAGGISTLAELTSKSSDDLLQIEGFGRKSLSDVRRQLAGKRLSLSK